MKEIKHPGWAIQHMNGQWLVGQPHSSYYALDESTFFVEPFKTQLEANQLLNEVEEKQKMLGQLKVVEAWLPLVNQLQRKISKLELANHVTPSKLDEIRSNLEEIIESLKEVKNEL